MTMLFTQVAWTYVLDMLGQAHDQAWKQALNNLKLESSNRKHNSKERLDVLEK